MPVLMRWGAVARLFISLVLVGLCGGGGALAHAVPDFKLAALPPAAITPQPVTPQLTLPSPAHRGPFGLTVADNGPLSARWRGLQPAIRIETQILAMCRTDPKICPPAAARYLAIIDAARGRIGLARLGVLNRSVNLAIRPMSDLAHYGAADVWATPLMTFASGAGDCEDYAIAKYVALRQLGMAARDLRLVIVHDRQTGEDHAVTAAWFDDQWLILDNRTMMLMTDAHERFLTPLAALGNDHEAAAPAIATAVPAQPSGGMALASRDLN
jgi:predicted transglutaminase-like cysteine proteinase